MMVVVPPPATTKGELRDAYASIGVGLAASSPSVAAAFAAAAARTSRIFGRTSTLMPAAISASVWEYFLSSLSSLTRRL